MPKINCKVDYLYRVSSVQIDLSLWGHSQRLLERHFCIGESIRQLNHERRLFPEKVDFLIGPVGAFGRESDVEVEQ